MDLSKLLTLRELAQRGTMAATAKALFITPSAVSQQITLLERDVGVKLTQRRGRGVNLTTAGQTLILHTDRVVRILKEAEADIATLGESLSADVKVATFPSIAAALLGDTAFALQLRHPGLRIVFQETEPAEALTALSAWHTDIAIVDDLAAAPDKHHDTFDFVPLITDCLSVLSPEKHLLAAHDTLSIQDLANESWALDSTSSSFDMFLTRLCVSAGYKPRVNAHCNGFEMVAGMVASGCSISITSGLRLVAPLKGIKAVPLQPRVDRSIFLAFRKEERHHPAIKAFVEESLVQAKLLNDKDYISQAVEAVP